MNRYIKYQAIILVSIVLFVLFGTLRFTSLVKRINKESELISELSLQILNSRRFEKNFIERHNLNYYVLQKTSHYKLDSLIAESVQYSDFIKQDLIKAAECFNNYEAIFDSLANHYISIGIDENSGYQGKLRTAIHEVESDINELHNDKLYCLLLQCRRNEKDFLSRNDQKYVDSFHKNLQAFSSSVAVEVRKKKKISNIQVLICEYQTCFDSLVFLKTQIGLDEQSGLYFRMRGQVRAFEHLLKNLIHTIYKDGEHKIRNSFLLFGLLFVLFLFIVFLVYYFIIKRINNQLTQERHEKNNYEIALRNTEDRYRKLVELSPDGIYLINLKGKILFANQHALSLLNCGSVDEFNKKYNSIIDIIPIEQHQKIRNNLITVLELGSLRDAEYQILQTGDKQPITVEINASILEKNEENSYIFINVIRDITKRKEMENYIQHVNLNLEKKINERTNELNSTNKSLQAEIEVRNRAEQILINSEQKYRTIFDNAVVGIFRLNIIDNLLLECNIRYANMIGFDTPQELVIAYNKGNCPVKQILYEAIYPDGKSSRQVEINTTNNLEQNIWLFYSLYYNIDNNIVEGIALDITEKKNAAANLEQILKKEKELNQVKTKLMSMVSHEFRTPLTIISLNLQLLKNQNDLFLKERERKYLNRIDHAVSILTDTIQQIELLNKEDIVKLAFKPHVQNINSFFDKYVEEINILRGKKISTSIQSDINEALFDKVLLLYIINNLLSNAIKYSNSDSTVFFGVICTEKELKITIEDKGIGIIASDLKYIFEPYFRGLNVQNITGTGLGLSIVKRCLDLHNGQISYESKAGQGTKVVVKIPIIVPT